MSVFTMFATATVRVINTRQNVIMSEFRDLPVSEAASRAKSLAETLANAYGDQGKAEAREFPFVAAVDAAYDDFRIEVRDLSQWLGAIEVEEGFVAVYGFKLRSLLGYED